MQEELKEIVQQLDSFCEKYNCRIDINCCEYQHIAGQKKHYFYKAEAIIPEQKIAET